MDTNKLVLTTPYSISMETLLLERARFIRAAISPRSLTGYGYDFAMFEAWCSEIERTALPASEDTVSLYLTGMLVNGKKVSTVRRHASAVAYQHRSRGLESPVTREIRLLLGNAKRLRCEPLHQMRAISVEELRTMVAALDLDPRPEAIRNSAMLTLGFSSALRRSNLVGLELADLEFTAEGLILQIRHEKQHSGTPRRIGILLGSSALTCPVVRLRAWLDFRGVAEGTAVFTHTRPGSHRRGLRGDSYWRIVKQSMERAGLSSTDVGGHSTRASFVTAGVNAGANSCAIANTTGHRNIATLQRYYRETDLWKGNVSGMIGL